MQTRPANWETLFADLNHKTEYRYIINGVEYTGSYVQGVPVIEKPMMLQPVIGRCCTGSFTITVRKIPNVTIPKAAPVSVYCRLVKGNMKTDWVPQGVFWITKRSGYGELITLTCRDNMILAGRTYTDKTQITEWPAPMVDVFEEIASLMNVEIDPRTIVNGGSTFVIDYPNDDVLMSEVLSMIAAAHGGNFIMTESGKIRLVPFPDTKAPSLELNQAYTDYTPYSTGTKTISRITLTDDADNTFTAGDDSGIELTGVCNICTQLLVDSIAEGVRIHCGTLYANGFFQKAYTNAAIIDGKLYIRGTEVEDEVAYFADAEVEDGTISVDAGDEYITSTAVIIDDDGRIENRSLYLSPTGLLGREYLPYRVSGAYFDPCIELGDTFTLNYRGEILTLVANSITVDCTQGYYAEVENGVQEDDEEEIPYVSPAELQAKRYISTGKSYFGNRINRSEGFVSEYMVDDIAVARMIANSNLFTMQRMVNGDWENVLYFNPVDMQYHFTGEVKIDTSKLAASSAIVDNTSIVLAADEYGAVDASTVLLHVIAYTGDERVLPKGVSVSGLPDGMSYSIGSADQDLRIPITLTIAAGSTFGSVDSINGSFVVSVTEPVSMDITVCWAKVNTGIGIDSLNDYNAANVILYCRSSTTPSVPSSTVQYTFSSGTITGTLDGWQQVMPTGNDPCYAIFALVSSRDATVDIPSSQWSTPTVIAQGGADASNVATVYLYIRDDEIPTVFPSGLMYTFATAGISGGNFNGWSRTIPEANGSPCWCIGTQAVGDTSVVALTDWTDPIRLVENATSRDSSTTYRQPTAPNPAFVTSLAEGDLWIDTSNGEGDTLGNQALYRWNGSQWVSVQDLNIPTIVSALTSAQSRLDVLDTQIATAVDATYVSNQMESMIQQFNSTLEQTAQALTATFNTDITSATGAVDTKFSAYIRASGDGVELGRSDSALKCLLNNTRLSFVYTSGNSSKEVAYFSNDKLFITYAQITDELIIGSENDEYGLFKWERTRTGLGLKYVSV